MAIVIPPDYFQVTYVISRSGDDEPYNVIVAANHPGPDSLVVVAESFRAAFADNLAAQMDSGQRLELVRVISATSQLDLVADEEGAVSAATLPSNCAVLVRKRTTFRGRAYQGRNYWPGFIAAPDVNEIGRIDAADLGGLQTAFEGWFSDLDAAGTPLYILHDETSPAASPTPVATIEVDGLIATQRRRMRK